MFGYLLEYRELIKNLVVSDLKVKYANSILGFAWSMLNPLMMLLVLYFVFSNVFNQQQNFAVYMLIGLLAWRFFSNGTMSALNSIVGKPSLVTKIYIPRQILTLSTTLSSLISSILEFLVLIPLIFILGIVFHQDLGLNITIILFPIIQVIFFFVIYGLALLLASMYVYFRDLNQIWDVLLQLGMFLSPIVYPLSIIPEKYMFFYMLNPITRVIGMYRDILLYGTVPSLSDFAIVVTSAILLLGIGTVVFNKLSRRFAEEV
jgi:lipopolysaccharide transport system permease protein